MGIQDKLSARIVKRLTIPLSLIYTVYAFVVTLSLSGSLHRSKHKEWDLSPRATIAK